MEMIQVRIGEHDKSHVDTFEQQLSVERIVTHPLYNLTGIAFFNNNSFTFSGIGLLSNVVILLRVIS